MRIITLVLLFVVTLIGSLIATMPLGFVLDRTPAKQLGVDWAQVSGTVFSGQIFGMTAGAQQIGDMTLKLSPMALVSGRVRYRIAWNGVPGSGSADLAVGRDALAVSDLNAVIDIEPLVGLDNEVRRIGGSASIRSGEVQFARNACVQASGQIATNVLARAAASYGQSGGELSGVLACDGPMLSIPLSGSSDDGDLFDAEFRIGLAEASSFATRVETSNPELSTLLTLRGFERENGILTYNRTVRIGGI
ncbi:MAG: type II secretion system protein N [Pseudomonadota bacterium]